MPEPFSLPNHRRTLLKVLAGLAAWSLAGRALTAPGKSGGTLTTTQFGKLSAALTGYPQADPAILAKVMPAFATPARRAALAALAAVVAKTPVAQLDAVLRARKFDGIANDLVSAWYSGIVTTPKGPQLALYLDAYVWTAMTYSKPMGACGGPTGYWADPPR